MLLGLALKTLNKNEASLKSRTRTVQWLARSFYTARLKRQTTTDKITSHSPLYYYNIFNFIPRPILFSIYLYNKNESYGLHCM